MHLTESGLRRSSPSAFLGSAGKTENILRQACFLSRHGRQLCARSGRCSPINIPAKRNIHLCNLFYIYIKFLNQFFRILTVMQCPMAIRGIVQHNCLWCQHQIKKEVSHDTLRDMGYRHLLRTVYFHYIFHKRPYSLAIHKI